MNALGDVYGEDAAQLLTSFGPCGRSKLLYTKVSGSLAVTRDTRQLFDAYFTSPDVGPLERIFASTTRAFSTKTGDGEMSAAIVLSFLAVTLNCSVTTSRSGSEVLATRVRNLQAVQHILQSSLRLQETITAFLAKAKIWGMLRRVDDMRYLWRSVLFPATNAAIARNLETILVTWLLNGVSSVGILASNCRRILRGFEHTILHNLSSGASMAASSALPQGDAIIEGRCKDFTALRYKSLRGTQSRSHDRPPTNDGGELYRGYSFLCLKHFEAPLLKHSIASARANSSSSNSSSSSSVAYTVKLSTVSSIANMEFSGVQLVKLLQIALSKHPKGTPHLSVIFCGDRMGEEILHAAALLGIILVDCVPTVYLERLCTLSATRLWDMLADFLNALSSSPSESATAEKATTQYQSQSATGSTGENQNYHPTNSYGGTLLKISDRVPPNMTPANTLRSYSGVFDGLSLVTLGAASGEPRLRIVGIYPATITAAKDTSNNISGADRTGACIDTDSTNEQLIPQLVLNCSSQSSASMLSNLIRRCLLVTITAADDPCSLLPSTVNKSTVVDSDHRIFSPPHNINSKETTESDVDPADSEELRSRGTESQPASETAAASSFFNANNSSVCVPGAGAAEMGWSALWAMVAERLDYLTSTSTSTSTAIKCSSKADRKKETASTSRHSTVPSPDLRADILFNSTSNGATPTADVALDSQYSAAREQQSHSVAVADVDASSNGVNFRSVVAPLVDLIADDLWRRILQTHQPNNSTITTSTTSPLLSPAALSAVMSPAALSAVIGVGSMCRNISNAFLGVPQQLLINATSQRHDCLASNISSGRLTTTDNQKSYSFQFADNTSTPQSIWDSCSSSGGGTSDSFTSDSAHYQTQPTSRRSVAVDKLWLTWKRHYLSHEDEGASNHSNNDATSTCSSNIRVLTKPGRLGLVVPVPVMNSLLSRRIIADDDDGEARLVDSMRALVNDVIETTASDAESSSAAAGADACTVISTASQFWQVHFAVLEGVILYLRIGDAEGIIRVKKIKKKLHGSTIHSSRKKELSESDTDSSDNDSDNSDESNSRDFVAS